MKILSDESLNEIVAGNLVRPKGNGYGCYSSNGGAYIGYPWARQRGVNGGCNGGAAAPATRQLF